MSCTVGFIIHNYIKDNNCIPILKDYSFWRSHVKKMSCQATEFEIRCWSDEQYAIETGERYGQSIINTETQEVVFKGEVSKQFVNEIYENYLTPSGNLKWFTLNFYFQGNLTCTCGHYGSEIYLIDVDEAEVSSICLWSECFPEICRVDVYGESQEE